MRAQLFIGVVVAAFAHEMEIEIGELKWKSVGIEDLKRLGAMGAALNLVAAGFWRCLLVRGPNRFEEAFGPEFHCVRDLGRRVDRVFENDAGLGGPGKEKTDGPALGDRMRSEKSERIGVA